MLYSHAEEPVFVFVGEFLDFLSGGAWNELVGTVVSKSLYNKMANH